MKKLLGVILAMLLCSNVFAQGIKFENGTFAEVLAKAKKENKMVFMDCYTTWCGPCKQLEKAVFPQKEVGDYFNAHFVSIKIDIEKGEGVDLKKKYGIRVVPTLLFMDANGKVYHTKTGSSPAAAIIEEAKIAGDPSRRIGSLEEKYAEGNRDPKFVVQYLTALDKAKRGGDILPVGKDFIANCPKEKLIGVDAFTVISLSRALEFGSEAYKYIIANKSKLIATEEIGQENYDKVISAVINKYVKGVIKKGSLNELESAIKAVKKDFTFPQQKEKERKWYSSYYLDHKECQTWFDKQILYSKETGKEKAGKIMINAIHKVVSKSGFKGTGIYEQATIVLENYLKEGGENLKAYYYLARLYQNRGNKTKALENVNIFIAKDAAAGGESKFYANRLKEAIEKM